MSLLRYCGHDGFVTCTVPSGMELTLQTAFRVVRRCGYTVTTCRHSVLHHSRTVRFVKLQSQPTPHLYLCPLYLWMVAAPADPLLTQQGLVPSRASALYTSPSGRLTSQVTVPTVHISLPAHMTARLKPLTFTVSVFRHSYCSQMEAQHVPQPKWTTWWNHSCFTGVPWLSAL